VDRIAEYQNTVKRILDEYADMVPSEQGIEVERIYDDAHGHYELLFVGWENKRRVHGIVLHVDIKDGKIWIQHDGTEVGIANDLVVAGIPKEQIVLAFHPPYKRPYTGYAVA
jgi:hypothetical protein